MNKNNAEAVIILAPKLIAWADRAACSATVPVPRSLPKIGGPRSCPKLWKTGDGGQRGVIRRTLKQAGKVWRGVRVKRTDVSSERTKHSWGCGLGCDWDEGINSMSAGLPARDDGGPPAIEMNVSCRRECSLSQTRTTTHTTPAPPSSPPRAYRWHAKYTSAPAG
jgi:hypothetical protein